MSAERLEPCLTPQTERALVVVGQAAYDGVPGPNIQNKTEKAKTLAEAWWATAAQRARARLCDDEVGLLHSTADEASDVKVATAMEIYVQLRRAMYPSLAELACAEAALEGVLDCTPTAGLGDAEPALPLASVVGHVRRRVASVGRDEGSLLHLVLAGRGWPYLQALLVHVIALHSNRAARQAVERGQFPDALGASFETEAKLPVLEALKAAAAADREAAALSMRTPMAVGLMLRSKDADAFLGLLTLACLSRDETYKELMALLLSEQTAPPLLEAKLRILITGQHRSKNVFCLGNALMPTGEAEEQLRRRLGEEAFFALRQEVYGQRRLNVYRASDLPNRHGSCNAHPHVYWECPQCLANGNAARFVR